MRTEKERMLAGDSYDPRDPELASERRRARDFCRTLNASGDGEVELRSRLISDLIGSHGKSPWFEPPFFCDYGSNIVLGDNVFMNFNCVILDPARVIIGNHVLLGPAVQIYTATHPMSASERRSGLESAHPIEIGDDVWIGGGAIICPGVSIGPGSVIGAGSVVTRNIPAGVFAAGNPCRTLRPLKDD